MFFEDLKNSINNFIIGLLVAKTHLYGNTIYKLLWRIDIAELATYANEIERAKQESGCYSYDSYMQW